MKRKTRESVAALLFILPSLLGIIVFYVVPYVMSLWRSFFVGDSFAGLTNYLDLFTSYTFLLALRNTAVFTLTGVPLLMVLSFLIALFLNSFERVAAFFRSALLIPVVIPVASLISVWQVLFEDYGAVNGLLNSLGFEGVEFFNSGFSMVMIVLIYVWKHCGFCVILFSAGIASVPKSCIESARLDGAAKGKIVTRIIIPSITPTTFFVLLMSLIYSFKIYREVFALFGDYPNENVYFLQNFVNNNYYNLNYPRLSAASVVLSVFIIAVLIAAFKLSKKREV